MTLELFLSVLFEGVSPPGFIEVRLIEDLDRSKEKKKSQVFVRKWYPSPADLLTEVEDLKASGAALRAAVFYGVLPRAYNGAGKATDAVAGLAAWTDIDFKSIAEAEARKRLGAFPVPPTIIVRSGHGLHVYWRMKEPEDPQKLSAISKRIAAALGGDHAFDAARILRLPTTYNRKDQANPKLVEIELLEPTRQANPSDFDVLPEPAPEKKPEGAEAPAPAITADDLKIGDGLSDSLQKALVGHALELFQGKGKTKVGADGQLDTSSSGYDFSLLLSLIGKGITDKDDLATVLWLRPDGGAKGKGANYIAKTVAHALEWVAKKPARLRRTGDATGVGPPFDEPLTDLGNAEIFAKLFGDRLRWDHGKKRWLSWSGHHWGEDTETQVHVLAGQAARERHLRAINITDSSAQEQVEKWARQSEQRRQIEAALFLARSQKPLSSPGDVWDAEPFVLGVPNGVVDLRTGELHEGKQGDHITMNAAVPYNPEAECPRFYDFVMEIFDGKPDLADFLWRSVGYSLTGDVSEQCLFICHGSGSNGKSVLLSTLRHVLGGYGCATPFTTLEFDRASGVGNDVAVIAGKRFVTASEITEAARLNEGRVKALTGGDPIRARFLYQESFEFTPVAKLWLAVNHLPVIHDDSHGFWRRVRCIPFTRQFRGDSIDKKLDRKLRAEAQGILAWAVAGVKEWLDRGLTPPESVKAATEEYREDSDPLREFVAARCQVGDDLFVGARDLYKVYSDWCRDVGVTQREQLGTRIFGKHMEAMFTKKRRASGMLFFGVGIKQLTGYAHGANGGNGGPDEA